MSDERSVLQQDDQEAASSSDINKVASGIDVRVDKAIRRRLVLKLV